jgi:putative cofactor-binding repeat protein
METRLADIRLGAASLTDRPVRCSATEAALLGKSVGPEHVDATVRAGRAALASETHTIDDIRSTAKYRAAVAGNLLEEFLRSLAA